MQNPFASRTGEGDPSERSPEIGCLIAIFALLSARFAFFLVWLFTNRVSIAFDNNVVPFLGLLFLPWTVLVYTFAYAPVRGVTGIGWFFVVLAVFADLGSYGSGARSRRQQAT